MINQTIPDTLNYAAFRILSLPSNIDSNYISKVYLAPAWVSYNDIGVVWYQTGTDEKKGQLMFIGGANRRIYANIYEGELLSPLINNFKVEQIIYSASKTNLPLDNLYFTIYDITTGITIFSESVLTPIEASTTFTRYTYDLITPIILSYNHEHRMYFSSPNSSSTDYYLIYNNYYHDGGIYSYDGANSRIKRSPDGGINWYDASGSGVTWDNGDLQAYLVASEACAPLICNLSLI